MVALLATGQPNRSVVPRHLTLPPKSCSSVTPWSHIASHSGRTRSPYEAYCQARPILRSSSILHRNTRPYLFPTHPTWTLFFDWRGRLSKTLSTRSAQPSIGLRKHGGSLVRPLPWRHDAEQSYTDNKEGCDRRTPRYRPDRHTKQHPRTWRHMTSAWRSLQILQCVPS